jgi:hypothetical protein
MYSVYKSALVVGVDIYHDSRLIFRRINAQTFGVLYGSPISCYECPAGIYNPLIRELGVSIENILLFTTHLTKLI